jgi:hypothetical protein
MHCSYTSSLSTAGYKIQFQRYNLNLYIIFQVKRFGALDKIGYHASHLKGKAVVNEKAGTRNFGEQIANRLIYSKKLK